MKCLERNKRVFYYANYMGKTAEIDEDGNYTGEYELSYTNPIACKAYISRATGMTAQEVFGGLDGYDKVVLMDSSDVNLDESSVLWVDSVPLLENNGSTTTPYDYKIKMIAESQNFTQIAIAKVKVE